MFSLVHIIVNYRNGLLKCCLSFMDCKREFSLLNHWLIDFNFLPSMMKDFPLLDTASCLYLFCYDKLPPHDESTDAMIRSSATSIF